MFLQPPPPHGRCRGVRPDRPVELDDNKVILKIGVTPRKQALSNMTINQPEVKCPAFGQQLWIWKEAEAVHKLILEIEVTPSKQVSQT